MAAGPADQNITCPKCQASFPLTEALTQRIRGALEEELLRDVEKQKREMERREAAILVRQQQLEEQVEEKLAAREGEIREKAQAAAGKRYEAELADARGELAERKTELAEREAKIESMRQAETDLRRQKRELEDMRKEMDSDVERRLEAGRAGIAEDARRRALKEASEAQAAGARELADLKDRLARADDERKAEIERARARERETAAAEKADLEARLTEGAEKMKQAQARELELLKKGRELEDQKAGMALELERRVQEQSEQIREEAVRRAEEEFRLKLAQRDHQIEALKNQAEDMRRKAEQGSQQTQGEALELQFEAALRSAFPRDEISPVPKGKHGADVIQRVVGPTGGECGAIVWECKQAKNWGGAWIEKVKENMRTAKGNIAVIVSTTMPADVRGFDFKDGVFVTNYECALPLARALRMSLEQVAHATAASTGQNEKMDLLYRYLSGAEFRHRIQAIVEAFGSMRKELNRERDVYTKIWAKREKQLEIVIKSTLGMHGEFQAILGSDAPQLESMTLKALAPADEDDEDGGVAGSY